MTDCNILPSEFCDVLNKDPFTMVTVIWTSLQLIWVTMLLSVQLVQISRATTTLEQMKGFSHASGPGAMAIAAIAAGSSSLEGAELTSNGTGPDPAAAGHHKHHGSWWEHWKRLLGIDTFVATAIHGSKADEVTARRRQNPFTRGCLTNCKDFFCDPAPVFGRRDNGEALLGGEKVDYTSIFEPPPRTMMRKDDRDGHGGTAGVYTSVGTDEHV